MTEQTIRAAGTGSAQPRDVCAEMRAPCQTCGDSKVDPGGLPICRECGEADARSEREGASHEALHSINKAIDDARDAALEKAAQISENFGPSRPIVTRNTSLLIYGRWEGEQAASTNIAAAIRALKSTTNKSEG